VIEFGIVDKYRLYGSHPPRGYGRLERLNGLNLRAQIGRGVDQEPVVAIRAQRDARLRARGNVAPPRRTTIRAGAIPLRQSAARRRAEKPDADNGLRLASPCVAGALKEDRHVLEGGLDPTLFLGRGFHRVERAVR
jgi:hypothetical protein